ncbi:hypothetical protein EN871_18075 [bacterium M00.F.Ca.ET.228.01.1.1]|nr:hypothetical protein EN871_18075 [bacterium M00.F.Ca.ET.228.01.1.1]TGR99025.1 hypothetical protein EN834_20715 [bacterium M00.F.Ca.ET.191.01.1.1]TGU03338.1 hypothetical protein EN798_21535 [bacterium M00.F.Ca.ET.155.01.1.1]
MSEASQPVAAARRANVHVNNRYDEPLPMNAVGRHPEARSVEMGKGVIDPATPVVEKPPCVVSFVPSIILKIQTPSMHIVVYSFGCGIGSSDARCHVAEYCKGHKVVRIRWRISGRAYALPNVLERLLWLKVICAVPSANAVFCFLEFLFRPVEPRRNARRYQLRSRHVVALPPKQLIQTEPESHHRRSTSTESTCHIHPIFGGLTERREWPNDHCSRTDEHAISNKRNALLRVSHDYPENFRKIVA